MPDYVSCHAISVSLFISYCNKRTDKKHVFFKIAAAVREPEASERGSSRICVSQYIKGAKKSHFVQAQSIVVDFRSGCFAV